DAPRNPDEDHPGLPAGRAGDAGKNLSRPGTGRWRPPGRTALAAAAADALALAAAPAGAVHRHRPATGTYRNARHSCLSMRRVGLILAVTAGILLLLAGAGLVWLSRTELAPHAARLATDMLGRNVSVEHFALRPGVPTELEIRNLRIANAAWGSAPDLLQIASLSARIDPAA